MGSHSGGCIIAVQLAYFFDLFIIISISQWLEELE